MFLFFFGNFVPCQGSLVLLISRWLQPPRSVLASEEIIVFAKWVELRSSELEERQIVQQHLTNLVTKLWPSATIDVFGSTGVL